jgi:flagellar motor switch protein FliG
MPQSGTDDADKRDTNSGRRKAAILLTALGDQVSPAVLRTMKEDEVQQLAQEISLLASVSPEERSDVVNEFVKLTQDPSLVISGGLDYATSVLVAAFGPETGKRMASRLSISVGDDTSIIETLRKADPRSLARIIEREHPQTIALIMCHLGASRSAGLLSSLSVNLRNEVARRMATLDQISPDVVNKLAKAICTKLDVLGEPKLESCGGVRTLAEVLNQIESSTCEEILEGISADDPSLAAAVRQRMFVFDDLLGVSSEDLRVILGKVDRKMLTLSLKGTSPQVKNHLKSVLSSRAAEMIEEDLQALGPVRIRDVQAAQQHVIEEARKLQKEGKISLQSSGSEEFVQ